MKKMWFKLWNNPGPDSGWSWVIAVSCSFLIFCTLGVNRTSGILFVAFLQKFEVTREEASLPFSLCLAMSSLSSFFAAMVAGHFSVRRVIFFAGLILSLALSLCYFANSLNYITVCFGFYGIGTGLILPLLPVVLNQYFDKYRSTANGILLGGGSIGGIVLPSVISFLMEKYELRGTLLIYGGIVLHSILAAALLRSRNERQFPEHLSDNKIASENEKILLNNGDISTIKMSVKLKGAITPYILVLQNPFFYCVNITNICSVCTVMTFNVVIVDYGLDLGMESDRAVLLIIAGAIPDLIGRMCSGFITDCGFVRRKNLLMLSRFLIVPVMLLVASARNETTLFIGCVAYGLIEGIAAILTNVLAVEYLGIEKLPAVSSLMWFFLGITFTIRSWIIGLFRDYFGTYRYLFVFLGGMSSLVVFAWALEPLFLSMKAKKNVQDHPKQLLK